MAGRACAALLVVSACVMLVAAPVAAQSDSTMPRTPHGDPDIQGIFTFRAITPLERPAALADKATLTEEEAAAFEASERTRQNRDLFDPESGAPSAGYQSRAEGGVLSYNEFWYERRIELFECACHEGNIGMHGILAGARELDTQSVDGTR